MTPAQAKKSGGRAPRDKGSRFERAIVRLLQEHGLAGERVPLSGAAGGSYRGDLTCPCLGRDLVIEAKARRAGFSSLYKWLEGPSAVFRRFSEFQSTAVTGFSAGSERVVFRAWL